MRNHTIKTALFAKKKIRPTSQIRVVKDRVIPAGISRKHHICKACGHANLLRAKNCSRCHTPLLVYANACLSIWSFGHVPADYLRFLLSGLTKALQIKAVIQPVVIPETPYKRRGWRGLGVIPMLNDLLARQLPGVKLNLGVTKSNIVPDSRHNFLFGIAYLSLPAAVLGIEPLTWDYPSDSRLKKRMLQIALHELGHCLGLGHHGYEDGVRCVMVGDEEVDSVEGIDQGIASFCRHCQSLVSRRLGLKPRG